MTDKTKVSVLVVEDADSIRALLRSILTGAGYEVAGLLANGRGVARPVLSPSRSPKR